jgi:hypothetical protein
MTENNKDSLSDLYGVRFGPGNSNGNGNDREDEEEKEESQTPIADEEVRQFEAGGNAHGEKEEDNAEGDEGVKQKQQQEQEEDEQTPSEKLLDLANSTNILLFKDQYRIPYVLITVCEHLEILRVESNAFRRFLTKLYYDSEGKIIGSEAVKNVVSILQARADFEGPTYPLSLRVAWHNDDIYYDMTNDNWSCVRITPQEWQLVDKTPIPMFMRYTQISQADAIRDYPLDIFDQFLGLTNLKRENEDDRLLLMVYIVSLFIPDIPHVMLVLHGEKGSAKSTLQTLIKMLVDPAKPRLLTVYKDEKEFIQQLAHNHVAFYDNLKHTPRWLSDEACKAVTGVGSTKRKLFSDDDDIVYEYKRCLGFNGINVSLTEPDALDRSLMIELERIKRENARQEVEIMEEFYELRPRLLGYIFDILVKTLEIKPTVILEDLPRMADFAIWGEAISRAMGYPEMEFIDAYYKNIGRQNIEAIESDPLGQAISIFEKTWYDEQAPSCWQGLTSRLLEILERIALENHIRTDHNSWPQSADALTKRLRVISSNLREGPGINVAVGKIRTGSRRGLSVTRVWKNALHASAPYQTTFDSQFQLVQEVNTG